MKYRKGYKYQLAEDEVFQTSFSPIAPIITKRIHLLCNGELRVLEGYAWDGTSGPVFDRETNQRASAGHDALYELMRKGKLPHVLWRKADVHFAIWQKEDGAWPMTITVDWIGLSIAGGKAALPCNRKKVHSAP